MLSYRTTEQGTPFHETMQSESAVANTKEWLLSEFLSMHPITDTSSTKTPF